MFSELRLSVFARRPSQLVRGLVLCTLCLLLGCGDAKSLVMVKGSAMAKNAAAKGAVVMFHPVGVAKGLTASGVVGDDGTFVLSSGLEAGVAPGSYKVTIVWPDPSVKPTATQMMMGTGEDGPDMLGGKYADRNTTPLTAQVESGQAELPVFNLEMP